MAKITPANLAPDAYPRIRGVVITYEHRGVMVAQKWPRKRGTPTNPKVIYTSKQFSYASQMAANAEPMSMETARYLSQDTVWLPRDLLVRAAYGNLYEITGPNGEIYTQAPHNKPNPPRPPVVWDIAASATMTQNNFGWNNYTLRQRVAAAGLAASGNRWRVTFTAANISDPARIGEAWIEQGAAVGTAYSFARPPKQLTFAGSPSITIPIGQTALSDPIEMSITPGQPLLISLYFNGVTGLRSINPYANWQTYYRSGNFASTVVASGFTTYWSAVGVPKIETRIA